MGDKKSTSLVRFIFSSWVDAVVRDSWSMDVLSLVKSTALPKLQCCKSVRRKIHPFLLLVKVSTIHLRGNGPDLISSFRTKIPLIDRLFYIKFFGNKRFCQWAFITPSRHTAVAWECTGEHGRNIREMLFFCWSLQQHSGSITSYV